MQTKTISHNKLQHNTGIAVQNNAAQYSMHKWWYSATLLAANAILGTGKFAKMVHLDFFGEDGGKVLITLT